MLVEEKMDMSGCIILIKAILTLCTRSKRSKSGSYWYDNWNQGLHLGRLGKEIPIFLICN